MRRALALRMASTRKPTLKPGFGLGDWLTLQKVTTSRSTDPKAVITHDELSRHTSRYDCWMAIDGKVYDITQYVPYHPGGEDVLLKGAGKDCSVLFKKFHAWVNVESLLSRQLVGLYAGDAPVPTNARAKKMIEVKEEKDTAVEIMSESMAGISVSVFKSPEETAGADEGSKVEEDLLQAAAEKLLEENREK